MGKMGIDKENGEMDNKCYCALSAAGFLKSIITKVNNNKYHFEHSLFQGLTLL